MTTNPRICLSMLFGIDTNDLSVPLNGPVIDTANTMRLLGVSIDKDLNFNVLACVAGGIVWVRG